ncbi:A-kinase anchor protein 7 isoform gamma-like protein [Aix galericulata]|nr:A-kinase anchor protein 7 isoform gamma-like protein [Aix galericulata]
MEPQQIDERWDAPEVTVQVRPQKLSQGWEAPEVTVQVWPQRLSPRWEMPEVTVQMQLQQRGQGPALPHITVQVQPQVQGQQMAGVKVTVQMHSGCEPEEVTHVRDQGDEVLGNGEQLTRKQNQGDLMARYESEREVNEAELVPQGAWNQKQDQEGEVIKFQQEQNQKGERVEVTELQAEDQAGLDRMVTEEQLQDQSQERENLKADLSPQQEGQRDTEMRQDQSDVHIQEEPKGLVEEQQEDLEQEVPKKRPRETPNYFVSIPITDDQILDRIEDVQELIFTKEPDLLRAFLPVQTMHLTIIVAHLATEEEVKKAVLALKQSKAKVEAILQGKDLIMTFHGIGQFNNQVIYVKMSEENQKMLSRIAKAVEECFNEMNLDISGSKDFKPHLTFLKLSKAPRLKRKGFRKICLDLYKEYEDSFFGTEVFSQIDLCAMRKKKQESGYYYCECSINVGSRGTEESKEQEMQMEDKGETSSEDPPGSAAGTETEATAASCYLASHPVAADDKPSENIAEALIASKEKEIYDVNGQPEATDETFLAAGEICSESVPALLPVRLDALPSVEENQEKAKITDNRLQKTEATVCAPDLPTSSEAKPVDGTTGKTAAAGTRGNEPLRGPCGSL